MDRYTKWVMWASANYDYTDKSILEAIQKICAIEYKICNMDSKLGYHLGPEGTINKTLDRLPFKARMEQLQITYELFFSLTDKEVKSREDSNKVTSHIEPGWWMVVYWDCKRASDGSITTSLKDMKAFADPAEARKVYENTEAGAKTKMQMGTIDSYHLFFTRILAGTEDEHETPQPSNLLGQAEVALDEYWASKRNIVQSSDGSIQTGFGIAARNIGFVRKLT